MPSVPTSLGPGCRGRRTSQITSADSAAPATSSVANAPLTSGISDSVHERLDATRRDPVGDEWREPTLLPDRYGLAECPNACRDAGLVPREHRRNRLTRADRVSRFDRDDETNRWIDRVVHLGPPAAELDDR